MKNTNNSFVIIYITTKDKQEARQISEVLLKDRLIACANIIDKMESMYWWDGKIQNDQEVVLIVKTKRSLTNKIIKKVKSLHSYKCPCILALPIIDGSTEYLGWIEK